jgi:hypothetical protein
MQISMLGIDLGKNSCSLVGLDATGKVAIRRPHANTVVVALAAKTARIVWALLRHGGTFQATPLTA